MSSLKTKVLLLSIIIFGLVLRVHGLNWDQGYHLHPDERFLTMVSLAIRWPSSIANYFSAASSPLNPHNQQFSFFVYGLWPLLLTKIISQLLTLHNYTDLVLVGRFLSALADSIVILLVYAIGWFSTKNHKISLLCSLFYALFVLPIQLSHFFATDTYANLFLTGTLLVLIIFITSALSWKKTILLAVLMGLAGASKISSILFLPIILLGWLIHLISYKKLPALIVHGLLFCIVLFFTVHLFYPYLFSGLFRLNPLLISNWRQLKSFETPSPYFPPSVQWFNTPPIIFPMLNLFYFGIGPIWGILASLGIVKALFTKNKVWFLLLTWALLQVGYNGIQIVKPLRYLLPLYPVLAIFSGLALASIRSKKLATLLFVLGLIWPISFLAIYSQPHSRVSASDWITTHIPKGSSLSCDQWDDCLPLVSGEYNTVELQPFVPDSPEKNANFKTLLGSLDYLVITSNRTYGAISNMPHFYPATSSFYRQLFSGNTGFTKVAQFSSRPHISISGLSLCFIPPLLKYGSVANEGCTQPGIWFIDDFADETFTVYDHPVVTIFKKN